MSPGHDENLPFDEDDCHEVETAQVVAVTDKAALVEDAVGEEHWIPFSLIHPDDLAEMAEGQYYDELRVARWFAEREGIE